MKQLLLFFITNKPLSTKGEDITILLFRLFVGLMMIPYGFGMVPSLVLTIFAQVVCAFALTLLGGGKYSIDSLLFNCNIKVK